MSYLPVRFPYRMVTAQNWPNGHTEDHGQKLSITYMYVAVKIFPRAINLTPVCFYRPDFANAQR